MKVFVLVNDKGEFLCKRHSGKHFVSKTELVHVILYQNAKVLQNHIEDKAYWEHRKIQIDDFHLARYTLSLTFS